MHAIMNKFSSAIEEKSEYEKIGELALHEPKWGKNKPNVCM